VGCSNNRNLSGYLGY